MVGTLHVTSNNNTELRHNSCDMRTFIDDYAVAYRMKTCIYQAVCQHDIIYYFSSFRNIEQKCNFTHLKNHAATYNI